MFNSHSLGIQSTAYYLQMYRQKQKPTTKQPIPLITQPSLPQKTTQSQSPYKKLYPKPLPQPHPQIQDHYILERITQIQKSMSLELKQKQQKIVQLNGYIKQLHNKNQELASKLEGMQQRYRGMEENYLREIREYKRNVSQFESKCRETKEIGNIQSQEHNYQLRVLHMERQQLMSQIQRLNKITIKQLQYDIQLLQKQNQSYINCINNYNIVQQKANRQKLQHEQQVERLNLQIQKMIIDRDNSSKEVQRLQAEIRDGRDRGFGEVAVVMDQVKRLGARLAEEEAKNRELLEQADKLRMEKQAYFIKINLDKEAQVIKVRNQIKLYVQQVQKKSKKLRQYDQQYKIYLKNISQLTTQLKTQKQQTQTLKQQLETQQQQPKKLQQTIIKLQAQLQIQRQQHSARVKQMESKYAMEKIAEIRSLEREIEAVKEQCYGSIKEQEEKVGRLEQERNDAIRLWEDIVDQMNKNKEIIQGLQKEIDNYRKKSIKTVIYESQHTLTTPTHSANNKNSQKITDQHLIKFRNTNHVANREDRATDIYKNLDKIRSGSHPVMGSVIGKSKQMEQLKLSDLRSELSEQNNRYQQQEELQPQQQVDYFRQNQPQQQIQYQQKYLLEQNEKQRKKTQVFAERQILTILEQKKTQRISRQKETMAQKRQIYKYLETQTQSQLSFKNQQQQLAKLNNQVQKQNTHQQNILSQNFSFSTKRNVRQTQQNFKPFLNTNSQKQNEAGINKNLCCQQCQQQKNIKKFAKKEHKIDRSRQLTKYSLINQQLIKCKSYSSSNNNIIDERIKTLEQINKQRFNHNNSQDAFEARLSVQSDLGSLSRKQGLKTPSLNYRKREQLSRKYVGSNNNLSIEDIAQAGQKTHTNRLFFNQDNHQYSSTAGHNQQQRRPLQRKPLNRQRLASNRQQYNSAKTDNYYIQLSNQLSNINPNSVTVVNRSRSSRSDVNIPRNESNQKYDQVSVRTGVPRTVQEQNMQYQKYLSFDMKSIRPKQNSRNLKKSSSEHKIKNIDKVNSERLKTYMMQGCEQNNNDVQCHLNTILMQKINKLNSWRDDAENRQTKPLGGFNHNYAYNFKKPLGQVCSQNRLNKIYEKSVKENINDVIVRKCNFINQQ